jgi:hypothetical protein
VHAGGFNLGLLMRGLLGVGTPRGLQERVTRLFAALCVLLSALRRGVTAIGLSQPSMKVRCDRCAPTTLLVNSSAIVTCTSGC